MVMKKKDEKVSDKLWGDGQEQIWVLITHNSQNSHKDKTQFSFRIYISPDCISSTLFYRRLNSTLILTK